MDCLVGSLVVDRATCQVDLPMVVVDKLVLELKMVSGTQGQLTLEVLAVDLVVVLVEDLAVVLVEEFLDEVHVKTVVGKADHELVVVVVDQPVH